MNAHSSTFNASNIDMGTQLDTGEDKSIDGFKRGVALVARQYGADVSVACSHDLKGTISFVRRIMQDAKRDYLAEFEDALQMLEKVEGRMQQEGEKV